MVVYTVWVGMGETVFDFTSKIPDHDQCSIDTAAASGSACKYAWLRCVASATSRANANC